MSEPLAIATAAELRAELNDNGPTDAKGKRYDADTKWNVTWEWSGYGDEDCDLESASTSYELTVKSPQWEDEYDDETRHGATQGARFP